MNKASKNFRPNPKRAVYIQGTLDDEALARVVPTIILLQGESREPLTVYIDSPGGDLLTASHLRSILSAADFEGNRCQIITVAVTLAASAAADLLTFGDYSLAYPNALIHFHGVRMDGPTVTVEVADVLSERLQGGNEKSAMAILNQANQRFVFRYVTLLAQFPTYRDAEGDPSLSDLECFVGLIKQRLSANAIRSMETALLRHLRYRRVADAFRLACEGQDYKDASRFAEREAALLRTLIQFELEDNSDAHWTFFGGGLSALKRDFLLLWQFISNSGSDLRIRVASRWGDFLLSDSEKVQIEYLPPESRDDAKWELVSQRFEPIWLFFVALCNTLQEGEHPLSASDAYWMGLIDEVIGEELPCFRVVVENAPEGPDPAQPSKQSLEKS